MIADPALIENSPQGPIPRIADGGRKPMNAYAAPAVSGKFRIAIVVSGLGLSAKATEAAIAALPAGVTLRMCSNSRPRRVKKGMRRSWKSRWSPWIFRTAIPAPTLCAPGVETKGNGQRLNWAMSRFTGYAGVTDLLGQRYLSDLDALLPTMAQLARRGLYFFDDGKVPQSVSSVVAGRSGTAFAKGHRPLDDVQSALEIDNHLSDLETDARARGSAIGSGSLYPMTNA